MPTAASAVGHDELAVLKRLALDGALDGEVKTSCSDLAGELEVSNQTASRRLRRLEDADFVRRETVSDGQWIELTDGGESALRAEYEHYRRIFEDTGGIDLVGTVTDGMGEGRHYITLPGYMEQFRGKLGYEPFPGTLNVTLSEESVRRRSALSSLSSIPIDGWEDEERTYGPAVCHPARVESAGGTYANAHLIVPERTHHDEDQIELIAPDRLRDELELSDDDEVTIHVQER